MLMVIAIGLKGMRYVLNPENILGIVLAGGQSTRMGCDKALLKYNNKKLIDHMLDLINTLQINNYYVSGNFEGYPCIKDLIHQQGPVGAIYSVIQQMDQEKYSHCLFVPVDMPLLTADILETMMEESTNVEAIYYSKHPLPLLLRISETTRLKISTVIKNRYNHKLSLKNLLESIKNKQLQMEKTKIDCFLNVNYPIDLIMVSKKVL